MVIHRVSVSPLPPPIHTYTRKRQTVRARQREGEREGKRGASGGDERERRSFTVGRSLSVGRALSANL